MSAIVSPAHQININPIKNVTMRTTMRAPGIEWYIASLNRFHFWMFTNPWSKVNLGLKGKQSQDQNDHSCDDQGHEHLGTGEASTDSAQHESLSHCMNKCKEFMQFKTKWSFDRNTCKDTQSNQILWMFSSKFLRKCKKDTDSLKVNWKCARHSMSRVSQWFLQSLGQEKWYKPNHWPGPTRWLEWPKQRARRWLQWSGSEQQGCCTLFEWIHDEPGEKICIVDSERNCFIYTHRLVTKGRGHTSCFGILQHVKMF